MIEISTWKGCQINICAIYSHKNHKQLWHSSTSFKWESSIVTKPLFREKKEKKNSVTLLFIFLWLTVNLILLFIEKKSQTIRTSRYVHILNLWDKINTSMPLNYCLFFNLYWKTKHQVTPVYNSLLSHVNNKNCENTDNALSHDSTSHMLMKPHGCYMKASISNLIVVSTS